MAALPAALTGCHESRPMEGANDNVVTPGALLPAAPHSNVDPSSTDAGTLADAGPSAATLPVAELQIAQPSAPRTPATAIPVASLRAAVSANNAGAVMLGQLNDPTDAGGG